MGWWELLNWYLSDDLNRRVDFLSVDYLSSVELPVMCHGSCRFQQNVTQNSQNVSAKKLHSLLMKLLECMYINNILEMDLFQSYLFLQFCQWNAGLWQWYTKLCIRWKHLNALSPISPKPAMSKRHSSKSRLKIP